MAQVSVRGGALGVVVQWRWWGQHWAARLLVREHMFLMAPSVTAHARRPASGPLPPGGRWVRPTVLVDVPPGVRLLREECFGPVLAVARVTGPAQALALMGDTNLGLTASVFCGEEALARRMLAALDVGTATWNCCSSMATAQPWYVWGPALPAAPRAGASRSPQRAATAGAGGACRAWAPRWARRASSRPASRRRCSC